MISGPAKSIPVCEKAGSSFTWKTGRGGGGTLLKAASFKSSATVNQIPDQGSSLCYPELSPGFRQCFFDTIVVDAFMSISHNKCSRDDFRVGVWGALSQRELPCLRVVLHSAKSFSCLGRD